MSLVDYEYNLKGFALEDVIGRTIVCEDGIPRQVLEIEHSYAYPWRSVINEGDPESNMGYFVNNLSLAYQMHGKQVPTKEQQDAFAKMALSMAFNTNDTLWKKTNSGIVVLN